MWVRSQDKARLTNVEDFRILKHSNGNYDIWGNNNCNLGAYSTEEKTIKVLDMIEGAIQQTEFPHHIYPIFQMPQDSEV